MGCVFAQLVFSALKPLSLSLKWKIVNHVNMKPDVGLQLPII